MQHPDRDQGFTLIELLIVIVILGILATVVVFAVGGITDRGTDSAQAADEKTIVVAEEAYRAQEGSYTDEQGLVDAGLMRGLSELHDITLAGDDYTLTYVGPSGSPATTLPTPPALPIITTFGATTILGSQYGSGADTYVLLSSDLPSAQADFAAYWGAACNPPGATLFFVSAKTDALIDVIAADPEFTFFLTIPGTPEESYLNVAPWAAFAWDPATGPKLEDFPGGCP